MRDVKRPIRIVLGAIAMAAFLGASAPAADRADRKAGRRRDINNKTVIGVVEKMTGPSFIYRGGGNAKTGVSLGLRIFENDRLSTAKGRLHMRCKDDTMVEMGENSSFEVERVRFKPADAFDESVFRFIDGIVRVTAPQIQPLKHFAIKTANAIIKAEGAVDLYAVQIPGERDMMIRVEKGRIELVNAITNEHARLSEGEGAYLKISGAIHQTERFQAGQFELLKARTRI